MDGLSAPAVPTTAPQPSTRPDTGRHAKDEVDAVLPAHRLLALGLQHVLLMYANAIAVPLIIGGALKMPKDQIALLINADLFACGIATLIQTIGLGPFGIRLPVIMGVTAIAIQPMLAMAAMPGVGLDGIYGAVIAGGVYGLLVVPVVGQVMRFFPPVVTGTILTMIGIALTRVAVGWAGGGAGAADFGAPGTVAVAASVLTAVLLLARFGPGFVANISVLLGITLGYGVTLALGWTRFDGIGTEPWLRVVLPLQFGTPSFHLVPCLIMCLVMTIVFIEATGMFLALSVMTGRPVGTEDIRRGLRADALGTLIGGLFNTFPYLSYSQNVGLVGLTGVHSRWVCASAGGIMLLLGLVPKIAFVAASIPQPVLGGASLVMFGMVAATGIRILAQVDYARPGSRDALVIAVSLGLGLIPIVQPAFFRAVPEALQPIVKDPILLTAIAAIALNALLGSTGTGPRSD
ncbi:nucleobase:cation symporter-2 family protein [Methylobacterium pseudosasicola]|uniref:Nucleobase:cation symporter-2, NCS2 family n=1 Tax=Methylobacterium pseudosasicola TaxID=582667 RepID=A0A1I4MFV3_9HYPH|nr:nucleobase:cation symporter-2 family protein [Methylobacterium pseudosasicola]SFM01926.1 nucleobase:cation symporter-2, NCS2 family [Methylobacterium pseudosasicola]